ncbi:MAG: CotH kinase family protein [Firmicutes bacterium]|nr:CotH kinase family protein [Bacillota bacterium]
MKKIMMFTFILFWISSVFLYTNQDLYGNDDVLDIENVDLNPTFSHQAGFYDTAILLEIYPKENTSVYYTLDSSEPTRNSILYTGPILIEEDYVIADGSEIVIQKNNDGTSIPEPSYPISMIRSGSKGWISPLDDIFKATVVKTIAFDQENNSSQLLTNSYFVSEDMSQRYTFPVMSLSTDIDNLYDYETGINVPGVFYDPDLGEDSSSNRTGNYYQTGDEWEKPVHVEYFTAEGNLEFEQSAGIRVHGGLSRKYPIKSYRLYARGSYDDESYFNYQFFEDKEIDLFKRIILRAGGQTYQYTVMGEAAAQSLLKPLDLDMQYSQPVILFINGEYFGIRNIRDRIDRYYLSTHYGMDPDDVTILTGNGYYEDGDERGAAHYQAIYQFITLKDMTVKRNYEHVQTKIDVDNLIDYYIAELYLGNVDWPQNNILYWRKNVNYNPNAPYGHDGRWRWIIYDVDASFGASWGGFYPEIESFERLTGDTWKTGKLITSLLKNDEFKAKFVYRLKDLMDSVFEEESASTLTSSMIDLYKPEIQEHVNRWGYPSSYSTWLNYAQRMVDFTLKRPENIENQMIDFLNLKDVPVHTFKIDLDSEMGNLKVNSLILDDLQTYENEFYENLTMSLEALPKEGHRFIGWYDQHGYLMSANQKLIITPQQAFEMEARFEVGEPIPIPSNGFEFPGFVIFSSIFTLSSMSYLAYLLFDAKKNLKFPFNHN